MSTRARLLTISESALLGRKEPVLSADFSTQNVLRESCGGGVEKDRQFGVKKSCVSVRRA